jgi:hypothetical protein
MLLKELLELNGEIDSDVCDTEIDMRVYFYFDGDTSDGYGKFANWLCNNVEVARMSNSLIVCNFSNAFEPHKDKLKKFFNMKRSEFDEDEAHHEAVVNLIPLLSGYASDGQYLELLKNLQ